MANKEIWRHRVLAWRASGQRADEFCAGEEFSASSLRHWAWQLGMTRRRGGPKSAIDGLELARVVRLSSPPANRAERGAVFIEVDRARVEVRVGVEEETLAMVMRVLDARRRGAEVRA